MLLVETRVFTRQVLAALPDDTYGALQVALAARPDAGVVIRGSGGLRKMRWAGSGRGAPLFLYPKNVQGDLSAEQVRVLRRMIEEEYP